MTDDSKPVMAEIVEDNNENIGSQLVPQNVKPDILYLLPITGRPHMPAQVQPLVVNKKRWEETLRKASKDSQNILGLSYLKEVKGKYVYEKDFPKVGNIHHSDNATHLRKIFFVHIFSFDFL